MFQHDIKGKQSPNVMVKKFPRITNSIDYAKYYKIVLRSKDASSSSINTNEDSTPNFHVFNNVHFPEGIEGNAVIVMESFVAENLNNELNGGYTVSIKEIMQPRTWGSDKKGSTDIVICGKGGIWQNGSVCIESCGIPITNPTFFRNATITVQIDSIADFTDAFKVQGEWVLTFYIVQLGGDNVLQP